MTAQVMLGDASKWVGKADVVFTHPYAPLPESLVCCPMILNLYEKNENRQKLAEGWSGVKLTKVGAWGRGAAPTNTVYVGNLPPRPLKLEDLNEDQYKPSIGWFPVELPLRLLRLYSDIINPPMVVWDGFCGRGTVGAACAVMGLDYIGVDIDPDRVTLAKKFLGLR